jgi:hypothetical protein
MVYSANVDGNGGATEWNMMAAMDGAEESTRKAGIYYESGNNILSAYSVIIL